jgi:hypothetical protein
MAGTLARIPTPAGHSLTHHSPKIPKFNISPNTSSGHPKS